LAAGHQRQRLGSQQHGEQHKRDIPYSTLVQAFQSLVRPLLSKSDAELSRAVSGSSGTKALLPTILLKPPFKVTAVGAWPSC